MRPARAVEALRRRYGSTLARTDVAAVLRASCTLLQLRAAPASGAAVHASYMHTTAPRFQDAAAAHATASSDADTASGDGIAVQSVQARITAMARDSPSPSALVSAASQLVQAAGVRGRLSALRGLFHGLCLSNQHAFATRCLYDWWRIETHERPTPTGVDFYSGVPYDHRILLALLQSLRLPVVVTNDDADVASHPALASYLSYHATQLLRWYQRHARDAHPSRAPCPIPISLYNALLRVYMQHGFPPESVTRVLGYRPARGAGGTGASVAGPRLTLGAELPTVAMPGGVESEAQFLWRMRGGIPTLPADASAPRAHVMTAVDAIEDVVTALDARAAVDMRAETANVMHGEVAGLMPSTVTFGPADADMIIDRPHGKTSRSLPLRILLALMREIYGRVILKDGVAPSFRDDVGSGLSHSQWQPNGETLVCMLSLASNSGDVQHLIKLFHAYHLPLTGVALSVAMEQCVRFGDVILAHSLLQHATERVLQRRSERPRKRALPVVPGSLLHPLALALPPSPRAASAVAAVHDAYRKLVTECAAVGAHVPAAVAFHALQQAGVPISSRAMVAALRSSASARLHADVRALAGSVYPSILHASAEDLSLSGLLASVNTYIQHVQAAHARGKCVYRSFTPSVRQAAVPASSAVNLRASTLLSACCGSLADIGDARAVERLFAFAVHSMAKEAAGRTHVDVTVLPRMSSAVVSAVVGALAVAGDIAAATRAAHISIALGTPPEERALTALIGAVVDRGDLRQAMTLCYHACANGVHLGPVFEAALIASVERVVLLDTLPIPASAAAAVQPAVAGPRAMSSALLLRTASDQARMERSLQQLSAYGSPALSEQVRAALQGGNAADTGAHTSSTRDGILFVQATARSVCAAVAHVYCQTLDLTGMAARERPADSATTPASTTLASDTPIPAAVEAIIELLLLAMAEWPITHADAQHASQRAAQTHPRTRAAAARRLEATYPHMPVSTEGAAPGYVQQPWQPLDDVLKRHRSVASLLHALQQPMAPPPADVLEDAARAYRGRLQMLSPLFGPLSFHARLNEDEDGTGTLGRRPALQQPGAVPRARVSQGDAEAVLARMRSLWGRKMED